VKWLRVEYGSFHALQMKQLQARLYAERAVDKNYIKTVDGVVSVRGYSKNNEMHPGKAIELLYYLVADKYNLFAEIGYLTQTERINTIVLQCLNAEEVTESVVVVLLIYLYHNEPLVFDTLFCWRVNCCHPGHLLAMMTMYETPEQLEKSCSLLRGTNVAACRDVFRVLGWLEN